MIALCKNGPIILMLANRKIKKGEEVLYNYNGILDSYDTEKYEWNDLCSNHFFFMGYAMAITVCTVSLAITARQIYKILGDHCMFIFFL